MAANRPGDRYDDLYLIDPDGRHLKRLTGEQGNDGNPDWSPDGRALVFERMMIGSSFVGATFRVNRDGSRQRNLTPARPAFSESVTPVWSPDGRRIAFGRRLADRQSDIYVMGRDGGRARRLTSNPASDGDPSWQPLDRRGPRIALRGVPCRCVRSGFRVRVSVRDVSGLSEAHVFVDGRRVLAVRRASFSVFVRAGLPRAGRHRLRVAARDTVGNRSARTVRFVRCRGSAA